MELKLKEKDSITIKHNRRDVCNLIYNYELNDKKRFASKVTIEGLKVKATFPQAQISDSFEFQEEKSGTSLIKVKRCWEIKGKGRLKLSFLLNSPSTPRSWIVPAVMYNGNKRGEGKFPQGGPDLGWSFREDRCAIPSCSIIEGEEGFISLFTEPAKKEEELSSIKTKEEGKQTTLEILIPLTEEPKRHTNKWYLGNMSKARREYFLLKDKEKFLSERTFYIVRGQSTIHSYPLVYQVAWKSLPREVPLHQDWQDYALKKVKHLINIFYVKRGKVSGFVQSVGKSMFPLVNILGGGFCGKNLEIAFNLYRAYQDNQMELLKAASFKTANFFLEGRIGNGLFFGDYQLGRRKWYGYAPTLNKNINTRIMGEMAYNYLRLYKEALKNKEANPQWLEIAKDLADFMLSHQLPDGNFGKWWKSTGELVDSQGTNGAYIIWALTELYGLTSEEKYLQSAKHAAKYYIENCIEKEDYLSDALDSNCVDKEGGQVILRALLLLHNLEPDDYYLTSALKAGDYLSTWMFLYKIPFSQKTQLGKRKFSTFGGTAVSVAHHHLDPYGAAIALDWLRLWKKSGEERWREYALSALSYIHQLVANKDDPLSFPLYFEGYQPEQEAHTEWDYLSNLIYGRGSFKNVIAWVPALTLGAVLDIREEFPEIMQFNLKGFEPYRSWQKSLGDLIRGIGIRVNFII